MKKIISFLKAKPFVTFGVVAVIVVGGYIGYRTLTKTSTAPQYVTAPVDQGTLTISVSGTGQVSSSNQIDIKPEVSAKVLNVSVVSGQTVDAGAVIATLDAGDAQKAVRDAELNLENANLALKKLQQSADELTLTQAQNAVDTAKNNLEKLKATQTTDYQKAQQTVQNTQNDITNAYEDAFNTISSTFLDLPTVASTLDDILYSEKIAQQEIPGATKQANISTLMDTTNQLDQAHIRTLQTSAETDYQTARSAYDNTFSEYKAINRFADQQTIKAMLDKTIETTKSLSQAANSENNFLSGWVDARTQRNQSIFATVTSYQSDLGSLLSKTNSHLSSLLTIQRTLQDDAQAITNAQQSLHDMDINNPLDIAADEASIKEKELSLANLQNGPDTLDLQTQQLAVRQRQATLSDAREKLASYTITAPIAGVVASINIKKGDTVGSGTAAATILAAQQIAEISLNEVDVTKVSVGQKATVTFDAIDNLSITGEVVSIDTLGTTSQGVVSYSVKIGFDTQDSRIRPGMSASASIITDVKQDVLLVPNSAIKSNNQGSYVEILVNGVPQPLTVQVGAANDTMTEVSGTIQKGQEIITQTITPTTAAATTQGTTAGIPGLTGGLGRNNTFRRGQ